MTKIYTTQDIVHNLCKYDIMDVGVYIFSLQYTGHFYNGSNVLKMWNNHTNIGQCLMILNVVFFV